MAKLTLKSEQQIIGSMGKTVLAKSGVNDLNPGSILLTLLQAAAQEDFAQYYQMLQIVRNYNLDTTTGSDLDNRAFEYGIIRKQPQAASGRITILRESTFVVKSTTFFTGFRSRIAGDNVLFVNDASKFPATGPQQTLIIGRGTPNEEQVTYTPSGINPLNNTNYFQITLDVPLAHDHSLQETVILKQGSDISIASGTVVQVPASGLSPQISFSTTVDVKILAGDGEVDDVNIICSSPGIVGNIGVSAITGTTAFANPPFTGARAINGSAFSNGQNKETDTSLRNRIKAYIQSLSQSTTAGISNAINGLVDATTAKRVVSSNIILPNNSGLPVKIYIDDGTGLEPDFQDQGQEIIVASAQGGEVRLQVQQFPLEKAQVETLSAEPYNMSVDGLTLQVNVGNASETITFFQNEFAIPEAATAVEIIKAINGSSVLLEARTAAVGTKIVINSKADVNEDIQVIGGTANAANRLNFSTNKVQTFYLYKNDKLLSKDGQTAFIDSGNAEPYDFSGVSKTLTLIVDGKTTNPQSATINQSDFPSIPAAASASAAQVAVLLNNQIAGATASAVNGRLRITSNTSLSALSKIHITGGTANTPLNFSTVEIVGRNQDYSLNPELGIIQLLTPLVANDLITAGTRNTRAFLTSSIAQNYAFGGGETLKIVVDGGSTQTITFNAGANQTAQNVANFINLTLAGATAVTRVKGLQTFLEIRTNSLDPTQGSIEILSTSTANNLFGFVTDTIILNILPHTAYQIAANSGPYAFIEGNTLVVVLDNDSTGKTFVITMSYAGVVTSGSSTSSFGASLLTSVFPVNSSLTNFWVVFKTGANTISGGILKVENPTPGFFKYTFKNPAPANFQDFNVGDQASFSGMDKAANNGNFLITSVVQIGTVYSPVKTRSLSNPASLTPVNGDRYLIGAGAGLTINPNSVIDRTISNPGNSAPFTVTIASPAVFTATNHESNAGNPVIFSTTGTLPTGLIAGATYYVISSGLTASTFQVSAVPNGAAVITTGTQSGVHTFNSPSALSPSVGDRHIIATPANSIAQPSVQGRYTDSNNVNVQQIHGYRYLINGTGLNAWAGHDNQIAQYNGIGTPGWLFVTPADKDVVLSLADGKYHQFSSVSGTWTKNDWGSQAGKVAQWTGTNWTFTVPLDQEVRNVTAESKLVQYSVGSNTWTQNDWGGQANNIAQWNGANWIYTTPVNNDTVIVTDENKTYQFNSGVWSIFFFWIQVANTAGIVEPATAAGSGLIGQRRQITTYNGGSGAVGLASNLRATPTVYDTFVILPGTRNNVVTFFNNSKVTSLPTKANIELVNQGQKIQISSQQNGSDGFVQVTGGRANDILQFSNSLNQGLQAYAYYVGLIKLVHSTIYGDETNLSTFPGVGAAGIKFQILPPTVHEVGFSINVKLGQGISLSSVENDLKTKVISYVNGLGIADEVILSNIEAKLLQVQGIVDVSVISPTNNIIINSNELARTKASLITINVIT